MCKVIWAFIGVFLLVSTAEAQISFGGGGGGGAARGWPSTSTNKEITWANSLANAVRIGDGLVPECHYTDATLGPMIRPCTDANVRTLVPAEFTWCWYDLEAGACAFTFDPDATTGLLMYQFAANYRPRKSVWFGAASLSTDGTQCATPAEATPLASSVKLYTIICTDNDSSRMHGSLTMPTDWDGGTLIFKATALQTAASAGVIEYQAAGQCKGDTETLVTTANYGTEVVWTDTMTASSGVAISAVSGAVTFAGTCGAGDFVAFYIDIGAGNTTTAMATTHIIGFTMYYTSTSLSH